MDIRTQTQTDPAMIRTKSKPKLGNIRKQFKLLTLKYEIRI